MNQSQPLLLTTKTFERNIQCSVDKWYVFMLSTLCTFAFGIAIVLVIRLLQALHNHLKVTSVCFPIKHVNNGSASIVRENRLGRYTQLQDWAKAMVSGKTYAGKVLVIIVFVISMVSLLIYLYIVNAQGPVLVMCTPVDQSLLAQIDISLDCFFLCFSILRFIAAQDKLLFWFELFSIADVFTIPPAFVSVYMRHSWIGLRFMRALRIMNITEVFQFLKLLRKSTSIRLCQLVTMFLSIMLSAGGFIYLIENSGDPPNFVNGQDLSYLESIYFVVVTMSTVGYGDIFCKTVTGQIFIMIFITFALAIFANSIPEIVEILGERNKYSGYYKCQKGKKHVIVCGHITFESISNFLADFLHEDRRNVNVKILILDKNVPDLELQGLIKRHITHVEFYQGSLMNSRDLERVALEKSDACLVLTNKYCFDPDAEDAANIMRVISIKNYYSKCKVIIQLMQHQNKAYLLNIPSWNLKNGDEVVCLAELKMGFLAQSCLAPGFSTFLTNLFAMRSYNSNSNYPVWLNSYMNGASMEIYTEYLSSTFEGMCFPEVAEICYTKLSIVLIAIESNHGQASDDNNMILINPHRAIIISRDTQGIFIAESMEYVHKASFYCKDCHTHLSWANITEQCECTLNSEFTNLIYKSVKFTSTLSLTTSIIKRQPEDTSDLKNDEVERHYSDQITRKFDATGMFHWCEARALSDITLSSHELNITIFSNHIVVCIFTDINSPIVGLRNFIMPLRASSLHREELKHIILIGKGDYIEREWTSIMNFPKISFLDGSPLNKMCLRAVNINMCDMVVMLSSKNMAFIDEPSLVDKEAILCSLNVKSIGLECKKHHCEPDENCIPMITELALDSNLQYLDLEDEDDPDVELFMTQAFACGLAFIVSVIDSLMSTAYFNKNAVTLLRTLITGGATPDLEKLLAEGASFQGGFSTPESLQLRNRCRIAQLPLNEGILSSYAKNNSSCYGDLFCGALSTHGILCLALYRALTGKHDCLSKRYVITNPPSSFRIYTTDKVFCFVPFSCYRPHSHRLYKCTDI